MTSELHINVTNTDGRTETLSANDGWRVMEIIRDTGGKQGISIRADCGGCCACATCHVYVADEWAARLTPVGDEEDTLLEDSFYRQPNSRLSCQITMTNELDGLSVTLAPDAT